ncbi:hypothetical protein [Pseudomonas sp. S4_EA_1b]|uniref:hypothetical protein n=1 Tax=Pseudomonas sp. S4_EA_1b TaxID=2796960 RepID=UPI0018E5B346|nr:hypothetical protein [Pseudomonas sp. S4_EA_1b]MBI6600995.1 hypothetical protein [Pseudomonas sp. S4_EA_1b]
MSVQVSVESLSKCSWNGCPSARGIPIFLWQLDDGATLELIRGKKGFFSLKERHEGFQVLVDYYSRNAKVFVPKLSSVA